MKNAMAILFISHGVPMLLMGDEMGRSQKGNNNAYCHDNELTWLDWRLYRDNHELVRFVRTLIAFRNAHPVLRSAHHFRNTDYVGSAFPDISWHGVTPWAADWSGYSRTLAFMLCGHHARGGTVKDDHLYVDRVSRRNDGVQCDD